jgi:hypothetical protein
MAESEKGITLGESGLEAGQRLVKWFFQGFHIRVYRFKLYAEFVTLMCSSVQVNYILRMISLKIGVICMLS